MTEKYSRKTFRLRLEEMTSQLRDEILSGKRSPGDFLPSELDLSRQFHISNKTVRQGLDVLFQEGLIEKIPKIGSRVASPSADGRVVVRFGYHNTIIREMELTQMLTEFHRLHPHIRVQALEIPRNNYYRFVKEYMDSGMLDVVTINYNNFKEFTDNDTAGLFEPLPIQKETYAFLRNIFQYRDVVLALPLVFSPIILCYNKQHFAEKGIAEPDSSWTWDILLEHAEQLAVENERFGFYFHLFSVNRWPIFLLQSGARFQRNEQGRYQVCGTGLIDGLELCRNIIYMPHVFPALLSASDTEAEKLFAQGKVSMIITSYLGLNELKKAAVPYDVAPLPHLKDFKTLMAVIGLAVNRKSKMKEAARTFVDYMLSPESQLKIKQKTLSLPSHKAAAEWEGTELQFRPSRFNMYREIIPTFKLNTELGLTTEQLELVFLEAKLYWSKLQDKSTTCLRIEEALNKGEPVQ